jgi:hypothetical protein
MRVRYYWICGETTDWNYDGRPFIAAEFAAIVPEKDMPDVLCMPGTMVSEKEAERNYPLLLEAWRARDDSVAESNLAWATDIPEVIQDSATIYVAETRWVVICR